MSTHARPHPAEFAVSAPRSFLRSVRVGVFLGVRDLLRANPWSTVFIVVIMACAFLNLVAVTGILKGIPEGAGILYLKRYTGEVIAAPADGKDYIVQSTAFTERITALPDVQAVSTRYVAIARLEGNYSRRTRESDPLEQISSLAVGVDPAKEQVVTGLWDFIVSGRALRADDTDKIVVGINLLRRYAAIDSPSERTLNNVDVGSRVRLAVGGVSREVTIVGIVKSRAYEADRRIYMTDRELRKLMGRDDLNVGEIAIRATPGTTPETLQAAVRAAYDGKPEDIKVQTWREAQPKFLEDVSTTFQMLGNIIGGVGIAIASITIFIVVFINAIAHKRYIGIMKGIGLTPLSMEAAYVTQSLLYSAAGTLVAVALIYGILEPYFLAYPINFPFSEASLLITTEGVIVRGFVLFVVATVAGYVPAALITRERTVNAIRSQS